MTQEDSSAPNLIGAVLNGRYRLVKLLGEGGMGAVYVGESLTGEGLRAVKLLHPEFRDEPSVRARLFTEAETASQLDHPSIVKVYGAYTAEDNTPYLVMEMLTGHALAEYVQPGRVLPMSEARIVVDCVMPALQFAHDRGIVHRDLKPDNLFVVPLPGGGSLVKVLDFGLAKVMDAAGGMGSKTRTGMLLGTPGYMSPEQLKNAKAVDGRTDLWSMGVLLYEALSGVEAFSDVNPMARVFAVLSKEAKPIGEVMPSLANFNQFFFKALAREPGDRFQSAREMAGAFHAALAGPSSASVPSVQRPAATMQQAVAMPPPGQTPMAAPVTNAPPPIAIAPPQTRQSTQISPVNGGSVPPPSMQPLPPAVVVQGPPAPLAPPPGRSVSVPIAIVIAVITFVIGAAGGWLVGDSGSGKRPPPGGHHPQEHPETK